MSGKLSPVGSFAWFASKSGLGFPDHGAGWPAMCCRLTANKFKVDVSGAPRTRRRPFTIVVKLSARCLMRLRLSSVRATRSPSARRLFRPMHMQRSVEDLTSPAARTRVWMEDVYVVGFLKALIGAYPWIAVPRTASTNSSSPPTYRRLRRGQQPRWYPRMPTKEIPYNIGSINILRS